MTQRTRATFGRILVVGLLATIVAGCGKYGPPIPNAPEPAEEASEDDEERR